MPDVHCMMDLMPVNIYQHTEHTLTHKYTLVLLTAGHDEHTLRRVE